MRAMLALLAMTVTAFAGPIDDALKKVGPAYMCGPHYEYTEALAALHFELKHRRVRKGGSLQRLVLSLYRFCNELPQGQNPIIPNSAKRSSSIVPPFGLAPLDSAKPAVACKNSQSDMVPTFIRRTPVHL